jgi:hypothetical protein
MIEMSRDLYDDIEALKSPTTQMYLVLELLKKALKDKKADNAAVLERLHSLLHVLRIPPREDSNVR